MWGALILDTRFYALFDMWLHGSLVVVKHPRTWETVRFYFVKIWHLNHIRKGQDCPKQLWRWISAFYPVSVEWSNVMYLTTSILIIRTTYVCVLIALLQILSMLQQKQRSANDLLAEVMAHNAKLKFLLDSKNNEKISFFSCYKWNEHFDQALLYKPLNHAVIPFINSLYELLH